MSRESQVDRKALKRPDGFVQVGRRALESLVQERKFIFGGLGVVALVCLAYYGYSGWTDRQLNRDWIAYYQAEDAKEGDQPAKFKEAYEKGGKTRAAFLAAVSLADHFLRSAQYKAEFAQQGSKKADPKKTSSLKDLEPALSLEQASQSASEWYKKALEFSLLLPGERELLTLDYGQSLEIQNKLDEAQTAYQSVVDMNGQSKPLALLHLGRMFEMKKDKEKAKSLYQSVSTDFGNTEYARIAKNYLRRMDSALLANP